MDAKYEIALALLSETGRSKTASEVPEHGFLRQERAGAISKCWYFEDWHEMRRDRRSSAPSRVRVGGGEGSVAVTKAGIRDAEDDEFSEDNEDVGKGKRKETSTSGAEDSDVRTAKKAKTEKSSTSAPKRSAAGLSKRSHASSTAVDDLAASMKDSMQEREARASAREEKEAQREEERNRLEKERIDIARMDAETRRIEAETARDAQRQQNDLMRAMLAKFNS
ncbi:hypothetical protein A4X03_0g8143 [Tilletia caries]|uniref:Uncharacterized protein n=1 Tax=Tilletia caries TaxID=13290 RepID=A0A8T8SKC4_9BASI|nr:hypothetical protein A4X03_0g8143 [Tilletia caries]